MFPEWCILLFLDGSSPRVWGTRCHGHSSLSLFAVHPRVCGELDSVDTSPCPSSRFIPACVGNSIQGHSGSMIASTRFIPACVGNSIDGRACLPILSAVHPRVCGELVRYNKQSHDVSVHPRVCGELGATTFTMFRNFGSSPRVWGTRAVLL